MCVVFLSSHVLLQVLTTKIKTKIFSLFQGLLSNTNVFFTITQSWQCWRYCQLCIPIHLEFSSFLQQMMPVNVKLDINGYMRIIFEGYMFYWNSWFIMVELKQSWQCWHSCIAESLWKNSKATQLSLPILFLKADPEISKMKLKKQDRISGRIQLGISFLAYVCRSSHLPVVGA